MVKTKTQMISINNPLFFILAKSTENKIGEAGAKSLSDALKSNTTLTGFYLGGEDKRNNTNGINQQTTLFHYHKTNRQQDWRNRSDIIE